MSYDKTLVMALRLMAKDIDSEDGVAPAAINEAAGRLEDLAAQVNRDHATILELSRERTKLTERVDELESDSEADHAQIEALIWERDSTSASLRERITSLMAVIQGWEKNHDAPPGARASDRQCASPAGTGADTGDREWHRNQWEAAVGIICDGGSWGRGNSFDVGKIGALMIWADKEMRQTVGLRSMLAAAEANNAKLVAQVEYLREQLRASISRATQLATNKALEATREREEFRRSLVAADNQAAGVVAERDFALKRIDSLQARVDELEQARERFDTALEEARNGSGVNDLILQRDEALEECERLRAYQAKVENGPLSSEERAAIEHCRDKYVAQEIDFLKRNSPKHPWLADWQQKFSSLNRVLSRSSQLDDAIERARRLEVKCNVMGKDLEAARYRVEQLESKTVEEVLLAAIGKVMGGEQ